MANDREARRPARRDTVGEVVVASFVAWALIMGGFTMIAIAVFWSWGIAARESPEQGRRYLWPVYAWIYVITRWDEVRRLFFLGLLGAGLALLGVAIAVAVGRL